MDKESGSIVPSARWTGGVAPRRIHANCWRCRRQHGYVWASAADFSSIRWSFHSRGLRNADEANSESALCLGCDSALVIRSAPVFVSSLEIAHLSQARHGELEGKIVWRSFERRIFEKQERTTCPRDNALTAFKVDHGLFDKKS